MTTAPAIILVDRLYSIGDDRAWHERSYVDLDGRILRVRVEWPQRFGGPTLRAHDAIGTAMDKAATEILKA